jgi:hypothetical protein
MDKERALLFSVVGFAALAVLVSVAMILYAFPIQIHSSPAPACNEYLGPGNFGGCRSTVAISDFRSGAPGCLEVRYSNCDGSIDLENRCLSQVNVSIQGIRGSEMSIPVNETSRLKSVPQEDSLSVEESRDYTLEGNADARDFNISYSVKKYCEG